jgi:hypothetical protein
MKEKEKKKKGQGTYRRVTVCPASTSEIDQCAVAKNILDADSMESDGEENQEGVQWIQLSSKNSISIFNRANNSSDFNVFFL